MAPKTNSTSSFFIDSAYSTESEMYPTNFQYLINVSHANAFFLEKAILGPFKGTGYLGLKNLRKSDFRAVNVLPFTRYYR